LAREAAIRALELDDTLAEAHAALGMVSLTYEWNWAEAEMSFRRAVTLGPNSAGAHLTFAIYLYAVAHFAEATREIRLAEDLDPISPIIKVMICNGFFFTRQYEENLRHARQLAAACPDHPLAHSVLGLAYDSLGRHDEAVSELRKAVELTQEAGIAAILGRSYAVAGRRQEARAVIADLETRNEREYVPWLRLGTIYFALGERERAFECLERAYAERDGWMMWAGVDPHLDSFRDDQRFADVLRRLAFPASVNSTIPSRAPLPRPAR
jgi:tetratricopeptide (TPR) repeat protein